MAKKAFWEFKPVKALITLWILAAMVVTFLTAGEHFIWRFKHIFGARIHNYSIIMSNQVREASAAKPLVKED